jgi:hypothetical protein
VLLGALLCLLGKEERLCFRSTIKEQMAMLNEDGPQDTAEEASCAQGRFVSSEVEPRPAGFGRIDLVQHDRSSPLQQTYSKHRVDFALALMSEVSPERCNAANFSDLLVFVYGS